METAPKARKRAAKLETTPENLLPVERVELSILLLRKEKVILDTDLAALFGVTTKRLNEQVRRNLGRFPPDFMFQLTADEHALLRSQIATSKNGSGGRRYPPYAFTEHGALMAANVINSERAVAASVTVVRAFVRLRRLLASHEELAAKLAHLEARFENQFQEVFAALRALMTPTPERTRKKPIGFEEEVARAN